MKAYSATLLLASSVFAFFFGCGPEHTIVGHGAALLPAGSQMKSEGWYTWGVTSTTVPNASMPYPIGIEVTGLKNGYQRVLGFCGGMLVAELQKQIVGDPKGASVNGFAMAVDVGLSISPASLGAHAGLIISYLIDERTAYFVYRRHLTYTYADQMRDYIYVGYEFSPLRTVEFYYGWTLFDENIDAKDRTILGFNIISWKF